MTSELLQAQQDCAVAMEQLIEARKHQDKAATKAIAARHRYVLARDAVRALEVDLLTYPSLQQ